MCMHAEAESPLAVLPAYIPQAFLMLPPSLSANPLMATFLHGLAYSGHGTHTTLHIFIFRSNLSRFSSYKTIASLTDPFVEKPKPPWPSASSHSFSSRFF